MAKRDDVVWLHRGNLNVMGGLIDRTALPEGAVDVGAQHFLADVGSVDPNDPDRGPDWVDVFLLPR